MYLFFSLPFVNHSLTETKLALIILHWNIFDESIVLIYLGLVYLQKSVKTPLSLEYG